MKKYVSKRVLCFILIFCMMANSFPAAFAEETSSAQNEVVPSVVEAGSNVDDGKTEKQTDDANDEGDKPATEEDSGVSLPSDNNIPASDEDSGDNEESKDSEKSTEERTEDLTEDASTETETPQTPSEFQYEITAVDGSVAMETIVNYLKETEQYTEAFAPVYAEAIKGTVTVDDNGIVTVKAGGNRDTDAIRIYDNSGKTIVVYVYSNQVRIDKSYTDAQFTVQWNDNRDQKGARPDITGVAQNYELQFTIDGENYYPIGRLGEITGISSNSLESYERIIGLENNLCTEYLEDHTDVSKWIFNLSAIGLPKTYTVKGVQNQITYRVEQKNQYAGYTYTAAITGETSPVDSYAYLDNLILNTALNEYNATIEWRDNDNKYETRPESLTISDFEIYVMTTTAGASIRKLEVDTAHYADAALSISKNADGTYAVSLTGLPNYDEKGNPVHYALKASGVEAVESTEGDHYVPLYGNVDYYSSYEDYLFNGGTLSEKLSNKTPFTYTKIWYEQNATSKRTNPSIYLYVLSEDIILEYQNAKTDEERNAVLQNIVNKASAVQGYTAQPVPNTEGQSIFKDICLGTDLPLYDEAGRRVIYFALEIGAGSAYTVIVENNKSTAPADVVDIFNHIKRNGQIKYLLNNGQIVNSNIEALKVKASVTLHAAVLQASSVESTAYLSLERYDEDTESWVKVTYADYIGGTLPEGKTYDDPVTETLENIKGDNYTVIVESQNVKRYDINGNPIRYRYVETQFDINSGSTGDMNWVETDTSNSYKTEKGYYTGITAPGVDGQNVSMFLSGTSVVDGYETKIDNYINAPLIVKVTKQWFDHGENVTDDEDKMDGVYIEMQINRNGEKSSVMVLNRNGENNIPGQWVEYDMTLDRFDENGKEYTYSLDEIKVMDPHGITWGSDITVSYRVVDSETGEAATAETTTTAVELVADVVNTIGPGMSIELAAQKEWKDGGDISSEQSSYVALFHLDTVEDDRDSFGLLGVFELNKAGAWYTEQTVGQNVHDTIYRYVDGAWTAVGKLDPADYDTELVPAEILRNEYIFVEVATSAVRGLSYPSAGESTLVYSEEGSYELWDNEYLYQISMGALSGIRFETGIIADDESDPTGKSEYTYRVSEVFGKSVINTPCYIIRNTRYAEESYDLTKIWKDASEAREAQYILYKNGEVFLTFTTGEWIDAERTSDDLYVLKKDNVIITFDTSAFCTVDGTTVSYKTQPTLNIKISSLPKYDDEGNLNSYDLKEKAIYDDESDKWITISNDSAYVAGVRYSASCRIDTTKEGTDHGTAYGPVHHNNDITYWKGVNEVTGSSDLSFYKVWYDSGAAQNPDRPNIYFNLFRASSNYTFTDEDADGNAQETNVYRWLNGDYGDSRVAFTTDSFSQFISNEAAYAMTAQLVETISADRLYNAGNEWLWTIDLKDLPRYDDNGYPYVYFVTEAGTAGTEYDGNAFYGNMSADELSVNLGAADNAKSVYDIYTLSDAEFEAYKNSTLLILSDGVHTKDGDPAKYYSRAVVNSKAKDRTMSGLKVWNLPDGWTMGDVENPEVKFQLWRTTETYIAEDGSQTYTAPELNDWFEMIRGDIASEKKDIQCAPEMVTEFTLNSAEAGNYSFTGNSYAIKTEPTENGDIPLKEYNKYGCEYNYYVLETAFISGYPADEVTYNFGTFHTENKYVISDPYVKVIGQKEWVITEAALSALKPGETLDIADLAPVTVTLWAQTVTESGEALAGADPIKIAEVVLDPADAVVSADRMSGVLSYEFTEYKCYSGEQTETMKIPYYGPNGVPFAFYVTEVSANKGYETTIHYSSTNDGTVSYDKKAYSKDTIEYITLYETTDSVYKYQNNYNTGDKKDASFTNTYKPGSTTFYVCKDWADDYVDNDVYRPEKVVFTVGRRVKNTSGSYTDDTKFNKIVVTMTKEEFAGKPRWTKSITDLAKYDPKGNEYQYYIEKEEFYDGDTLIGTAVAVGDAIGNYTLTFKANGRLINTLTNNTSAKLQKNWKYTDGEGNDRTFDWDNFQIMRSMNILPVSVQYVLERSTDGTTWTEVPAADVANEKKIVTSKETGDSVLGMDVDIKNMTKAEYFSKKYFTGLNVQWDQLPTVASGSGETYSYRVIEYMTFNTGASNVTEKFVGDGSEKYGTVSTITTAMDGNVYVSSAENKVKTSRIRIGKEWNDNNGRDNTRPETIDVTIVPLDSSGNALSEGLTLTLKTSGNAAADANSNVYYSDYFYVAAGSTKTYGLDSGNGFAITETWTTPHGETYTQVITSTDHVTYEGANTWTFQIDNNYNGDRKTVTVKANKTWAGETPYTSLVRPNLKFTLQYKAQGTQNSWIDFTDESIKTFEVLPEGASFDAASVIFSPEIANPTYTWSNLKKYWDAPTVDGVAEPIEYRVREDLVKEDGTVIASTSYTSNRTNSSITYNGWDDDSKRNFEGTITNTVSLRDVSLKKTWTGNGTTGLTSSVVEKLVDLKAIPEMIRFMLECKDPDSGNWAALEAQRSGSTAGSIVELSTVQLAKNNVTVWKLPQYDKYGNELEYRVRETGVKYKGDSGFTEIQWNAQDTQKSIGSITVTQSAFKIGTGTTTNVSLINDYLYVSREITKNWEDESNRDNSRSDFSVTLYRDSEKYGNEISTAKMGSSSESSQFGKVTKSVDGNTNQWKIVFDMLPKFAYNTDGGRREYVYTWAETKVTPNYEKTNTEAVSTETAETNAYQPIRGNITVTKNWMDQENKLGLRPATIYLKLQWSATPENASSWTDVTTGTLKEVNGKKLYSGEPAQPYSTSQTGWIELTAPASGESGPTNTWMNLSRYVLVSGQRKEVTYRVIEGVKSGNEVIAVDDSNKVPGYEVTESANVKITATASGKDSNESARVTNTQILKKLTVSKTWTGSSILVPKSVTFAVKATTAADTKTFDPIVITAGDTNWTKTVDNLPVYDKEGNLYVYLLTETELTYSLNGTDIVCSVKENKGGAFTVADVVVDATTEGWTASANNSVETGSIEVTKVWADDSDRDGLRPDTLTVTLKRDGTVIGKVTLHADQESSADPMNIQTTGWSYRWDNLPLYKDDASGKSVYTVSEDSVTEYTASATAGSVSVKTGSIDLSLEKDTTGKVTLTNTHEPELTERSGLKTWDDKGNQDGKRPEKITVRLLADNVEIDSRTVSKEENWSWSFTKLYKYRDGGVEIKYTMTEDGVENYTPTVDGFNVVNKYTPEQTSIPVVKVWKDDDDRDGLRPDSVKVVLYADEKPIKELTLEEANSWAGTFTELDVYKPEGVKIVYTVGETEPASYKVSITGDAVKGFTVTNTHEPETVEVPVSKVWKDDEDRDGLRPDSVTVELLADDKETGETLVLDETGKWSGVFKNLNKYRDHGEEIVYTIKELSVTDYTVAITGNAAAGFVVTNTHETETIDLNGQKVWEDFDDQYLKRPGSITVHLLADDEELEAITVTEEDDWAWSWKNLPKNRDHGTPIVYTMTEDPILYYDTEIEDANNTDSIDFTITNKLNTTFGDLTISKKVTGSKADKTKSFSFKVEFDSEDTFEYTGSKNGTISSGDIITLKHDESITILNIPDGTNFKVTESGNYGYKVYATGNVGVIKGDETSAAAFTNYKGDVPGTGDSSYLGIWYGLLSIFGLGMFGSLRLGRRKKHPQGHTQG